ncbi:TrmH family RNA methyltransferase, partial [Citrobacter freundii complex sp. CFNIH6]|uniref:TrmH family RNA methyltransferase n=1 Tax=Citrobacter freundii complex sp. CFNIH6 TaxID=2080670 RepID=UPI0027E545FE
MAGRTVYHWSSSSSTFSLFMSQLPAATRLRFVLVGTQHPGNMGAAARALKTMGLARLVLVAPEKPLDEEAFRRSAGAEDVLGDA